MKKSNLSETMTLISFIFLCGLGHASDLIITKSFTGGWYDPAKNGQGFLLEIIKSNNQKKALTTWFTFDAAGNQYWLIGVGDINGQTIDFQMEVPEGGKFGNLHDPNNITNTIWGNVRFTFSDCNTGTVTWDPVLSGFHSGSMPITRSTIINNLNCTGGLYDELGDTIEDSELITALSSTGVINDASGKTKYEQRSDRIDYSVEIENVPVGTYELIIGGQYKGDIQVVTLSNGFNEGEIEFRDPVEPGKLPLDFDPRGQVVDIIKNQVIVLTSDDSGDNSGGGNTSGQAPPFGNSETELYMTNTGIYPLGQAKVKLRQRPDRVDFQVELEDIPVGFYDLEVSGQMQGVIEVIQTAAGVEGELEFRNPVEAGKELLDFSPFGELITVTQGQDTLFTLDFPSTPGNDDDNNGDDCDNDPSGDDCDDDNSGSGNGDDDDCQNDPNDNDCDDNNGNGNNTQEIEIEVDLINSGQDPNASGSVEYEIRSDRRDFKVKVEDLSFGTYQLFVGGQLITAMEINSDELELEFRDPAEPGKLTLNFDPLNQLVEIKQGGTVYLSAVVE